MRPAGTSAGAWLSVANALEVGRRLKSDFYRNHGSTLIRVTLVNRSVLIRRMVLNSICDDDENVAKDGAELGLTVERSEIVDVGSPRLVD
jgi:hypothetical protein